MTANQRTYGCMRDIDTIDSELRLVAALRRAARERGGPLPSIDVAAPATEWDSPQITNGAGRFARQPFRSRGRLPCPAGQLLQSALPVRVKLAFTVAITLR